MAFELLLERGQRTVAHRRQILDRDVVEDVRVDDLLEVVVRRVDVAQNLALQAVVLVRDDQIDQLRHLDALGSLVVHEVVVLKIARRVHEETAQRRRRRHSHVVQPPAALAMMGVGDVHAVAHVQLQKDPLQQLRRVIHNDLLERPTLIGQVLDIVVAYSHVKHVAA